jgi:hypothetical protein
MASGCIHLHVRGVATPGGAVVCGRLVYVAAVCVLRSGCRPQGPWALPNNVVHALDRAALNTVPTQLQLL